ncbi:hypothetical protein HBI67_004830 [Parastagonospora nodorum]|nr:hypothetical protein HBI67_004830 [Parastagonospora nodorum]KAH6090388.1 hypothetical protein HBI66_014790 [Parastagonospora nodorum]
MKMSTPTTDARTDAASRKRKAPHDTATKARQQGDPPTNSGDARAPKRLKVSATNEESLAQVSDVNDSISVASEGIDIEMTGVTQAATVSTSVEEEKMSLRSPVGRQDTTNTRAPEQRVAKRAPSPSSNVDRATATTSSKAHCPQGPVSLAALVAVSATTDASRYNQNATGTTTHSAPAGLHGDAVHAMKAKSAFPAINPGNHFSTTLPATRQPWPYHFPQAHCVYSQNTNCPVNWVAFRNIPLSQRRVYELRRPWSKDPAPWDTVRMDLAKLESKPALSAEGVRKRFAKVNKVIFQTTGVYFVCNGHGLQPDYGVPNDTDMSGMLKGHGVTTLGSSMKAAKACKDSQWEADRIEEDEVTTLVLQLPGQSFRAIRHVTKDIMANLEISDGQTLPYAATTFDRWYSCLYFGHRHSLPKRVYKLKQQPDRSYTSVDEGTPKVTIQTLLETYCLSQLAGTTSVSDMLLDEITQSLENEKVLYETYGTGAVCKEDCNDVVRLLDLQPEDIQRIWKTTKVHDPIRKLLIDLFLHKLDAAEEDEELDQKIRTDALRLSRCACQLWEDFADQRQRKVVESFMEPLGPSSFCAKYHNHHKNKSCYRSILPSERSVYMIDDTLDEPNVHLLEVKGVAWYRIVNKTGDRLDLDALRADKPRWDWERVRSINSWIYIKPKGPQHRQPHPVYFDPSEMDRKRRFSSHPGYQRKNWTQGVNDYEKEDG